MNKVKKKSTKKHNLCTFYSLSVCAIVSDVLYACSRWLHINLRPQSEQRSKAQCRAGILFRPLALPSSLRSRRTPIIHDIRASQQLCTAVARAELCNTQDPPHLIQPHITMQATGESCLMEGFLLFIGSQSFPVKMQQTVLTARTVIYWGKSIKTQTGCDVLTGASFKN